MEKVKHLFLLVGSNPLPNAVVGKLLIEPRGKIHLIYSKDSCPVAKKLREWLKKKINGLNVSFTVVAENDPKSIVNGIKQVLNDVVGSDVSVGLNYTGGTKMMSVHTYRALERWADGKKVKPQFSYLDAGTLRIIFDPREDDPFFKHEYVGLKAELSLKDLQDLHGIKPDNSPNDIPMLPKTAQALATYSKKINGFANSWNGLVGVLKNELSISTIKDYVRKNIPEEKREEIIKAKKCIFRTLHNELQESQDEATDKNMSISLKQKKFSNKTREFKLWLQGVWLEHYVLRILRDLRKKGNLKLRDCLQNVQTSISKPHKSEIDNDSESQDTQFEVDVITIRGYQLFGFSCKTINKKAVLKRALFEAYIRAQQLGGDEARVALVCCAEDPKGLEKEMAQGMAHKERIKVFGRRHLADLGDCVEQWIESQKGEE